MYGFLDDLEFVRVYLDDLLVLSTGDFANHLKDLERALQRLEKANLKAHVKKCKFLFKMR